MKRNQIRHIVIHGEENVNFSALSNQVGAFHVRVIERRLNELS